MRHLRLKFRRHEQQRERLRPAFGARDGLPRLRRRERPERRLEHRASDRRMPAIAARKLVGDVEPLREAVEPGRALVGESFRRAAAATAARRAGCAPASRGPDVGPASRRSARSAPMIHSLGRLSLLRGASQASGAVTSALAISLRSPSVSRKRFASRSTSARRRLVGDEMARELASPHASRSPDGARGRRARAALLDAVVWIGLAEHRLRARLVHARIEDELAAVHPDWRGGTIVQPVITLAKLVTSSCV